MSIKHFLGGAAAVASLLLLGAGPVGQPELVNTAAVKALAPGQFKHIRRSSFATLGDGGGAFYNWSASVCSLNTGLGDDGSQIKPNTGTGCWILDNQYPPLNPRIWGKGVQPINFYVATSGNGGNDQGTFNYCLDGAHPCLTITQATLQAVKFCVEGSTAQVNIGTGTFTDNIGINQPLPCAGSGKLDPIIVNPSATFGVSQIVFKGNGSANTTWNGGGCCGGTLIVSSLGIAGVEDIKMTGAGNGFQSTLFTQMNGTINVFGDVDLGVASVEQVHAENAGSSITFWGPRTGDTGGKISGNSARFAIAATGAFIHFAYGTMTLTGGPAFSDAFEWATSNGVIQHFSNIFAGGSTGAQFRVDSGGIIDNLTGTALNLILPGTTRGIESQGGRVKPALIPTAISPTGLGTGGSVGAAITAGSGNTSGQIALTTGTAGMAALGDVNLQYVDLPINRAAGLQFCSFSCNQNGQTWANGAICSAGAPAPATATQKVKWSNGGGALVLNSTYYIDYVCSSD